MKMNCEHGMCAGSRAGRWFDRVLKYLRSTPTMKPTMTMTTTTTMTMTITTGCRVHGYWLRKSVSSGRQVIGVGVATDLFSTKGIGVRKSVSMAGSIMASDTLERAMKAGVGTPAGFSTTVR